MTFLLGGRDRSVAIRSGMGPWRVGPGRHAHVGSGIQALRVDYVCVWTGDRS